MSTIKVSQPHTVSIDEARAKVQGFEDMVKKYGVSSKWSGNRAKLKGTGVSGSIAVDPGAVVVELKLGLLAKAAGVKPDLLQKSIEKRLKAAFEGEEA